MGESRLIEVDRKLVHTVGWEMGNSGLGIGNRGLTADPLNGMCSEMYLTDISPDNRYRLLPISHPYARAGLLTRKILQRA